MQEYELTVLVHADLESEIENTLKALRSLVTDNGGEVKKEDNWGKKKLAYRIKNEDFAIYVSFELALPVDAPQKISTVLNITDYALRYLLVKVNEKERRKLAEAKKHSAETESEE